MIHKNRLYAIADVPTAAELARELRRCTWTSCTGFRLGGLLVVNDSFSPDGAQEYAVFQEKSMLQVESLTVSWYGSTETLEKDLEVLLSGAMPVGSYFGQYPITYEPAAQHQRCVWCE